jgi:oligopeptidase B
MIDGNATRRATISTRSAAGNQSERTVAGVREDTVGRRQFTIHVKDLASGKVLPDQIENTPAAMAWADDNKTLFYVENDPITLLGIACASTCSAAA